MKPWPKPVGDSQKSPKVPARKGLQTVPQIPRPEDSRSQEGFSPSSQTSREEKSFTATTNLLIPATPMPCVLRSLPVAALDHLRGGESILPLPQPASLSDADITLRYLVETAQDSDRVQHLGKKAGQKVWE